MQLYHFTIERYADLIRENGLISLAEKRNRGLIPSNLLLPEQFPGEDDLVWLTKDRYSNAGIMRPDLPDGGLVLVTVDVDDAIPWPVAVNQLNVPSYWRRIMRAAALEISRTNHDRDWYVVQHAIPPEQIVSMEALKEAA